MLRAVDFGIRGLSRIAKRRKVGNVRPIIQGFDGVKWTWVNRQGKRPFECTFFYLDKTSKLMTEFTKKAVEMLLKGATLVSDPCPYCKGVRIMKDGSAFCVNCGREATEEEGLGGIGVPEAKNGATPSENLDQKLRDLTNELQSEKDYARQQIILESISKLLAVKEKLKNI